MPDREEIVDSIADKLSEELYNFTPADAQFAIKNRIPIWKDAIKKFDATNRTFLGTLKGGAIMYWDIIEDKLVDMQQVKKYIQLRNPALLKIPGIELYMQNQIKGFYNALYDYLFEDMKLDEIVR